MVLLKVDMVMRFSQIKKLSLLLVIFGFCSTFLPVLVYAESNNDVDFNLSIKPVIAISAPNGLTFDPDTDPFGVFSEKEIDVHVSTNSASGYNLTMSSTTSQTSLVNQTNADYEIVSIPQKINNSNDFPVNAWGYTPKSASNTGYLPIPAKSAPVNYAVSAVPGSDNVHTFVFATKTNTNLTPGAYVNTLEFSATVRYVQESRRYYYAAGGEIGDDQPFIFSDNDGNTYNTEDVIKRAVDELGYTFTEAYRRFDNSSLVADWIKQNWDERNYYTGEPFLVYDARFECANADQRPGGGSGSSGSVSPIPMPYCINYAANLTISLPGHDGNLVSTEFIDTTRVTSDKDSREVERIGNFWLTTDFIAANGEWTMDCIGPTYSTVQSGETFKQNIWYRAELISLSEFIEIVEALGLDFSTNSGSYQVN